ncbi:MAG: PQQ-binding-like beta-propeller repeat protein [Oscillospiraceae bacterium]|jgi:outer membrane protein assembly factor BamB|nr:PQQ-binding-like beta-propeller repeat protein [Oscillospiraceae bacterium]
MRTIKRISALILPLVFILLFLSPGTIHATALGGVTAAPTARNADEAVLRWSYQLRATNDWAINISDPVLLDNVVFVAVGDKLIKLGADGAKLGETALAAAIDYTCRPLLLSNIIYIPMSGGRLQAINCETLESAWVTDALPDVSGMPHQSMTTLIAEGDTLYFGTACADVSASIAGSYLCIKNGEVLWQYENAGAGYYWSGAAVMNDALVFAGDDGILISLDKASGAQLDTLDLGAPVRASVFAYEDDALVVTKDGKLHKVAVHADGTFGAARSVAFAASSTSSPVALNDKAYVGGGKADYSGIFAVIDLQTMAVDDSANAPAPVQASPLLTTAYGSDVYAYYTANTTPGALYVYDGTRAVALFTPAAGDQNYCIASAVAGANGTLYYTNDSGKLFAVGTPQTEPEPEPDIDQNSKNPCKVFFLQIGDFFKTVFAWVIGLFVWIFQQGS